MAYGLQEPSRNDTVAISTASVRIFDPRAQQQPRRSFSIRNTSPNSTDIISLAFGQEQAVAGEGVVLQQFEVWQEWTQDNDPCWQGSITAICATATGTVAITER